MCFFKRKNKYEGLEFAIESLSEDPIEPKYISNKVVFSGDNYWDLTFCTDTVNPLLVPRDNPKIHIYLKEIMLDEDTMMSCHDMIVNYRNHCIVPLMLDNREISDNKFKLYLDYMLNIARSETTLVVLEDGVPVIKHYIRIQDGALDGYFVFDAIDFDRNLVDYIYTKVFDVFYNTEINVPKQQSDPVQDIVKSMMPSMNQQSLSEPIINPLPDVSADAEIVDIDNNPILVDNSTENASEVIIEK